MINDKYFFENEKEELKKEAVFRSTNALLCGMVIATNLVLAGVNIISGDIISCIIAIFIAILWCFFGFENAKHLKNVIDITITSLKDIHEITVSYMEIKQTIEKSKELVDRQSKTLDEILKEHENGDTKEFTSKLAQSN